VAPVRFIFEQRNTTICTLTCRNIFLKIEKLGKAIQPVLNLAVHSWCNEHQQWHIVLLTAMQNQVCDFHSWHIGLSQSPRQLQSPDAGAVTPIRWAFPHQCNVLQPCFQRPQIAEKKNSFRLRSRRLARLKVLLEWCVRMSAHLHHIV